MSPNATLLPMTLKTGYFGVDFQFKVVVGLKLVDEKNFELKQVFGSCQLRYKVDFQLSSNLVGDEEN